jgi:hypothetical protein
MDKDIARLSPDLVIANSFTTGIDTRGPEIILIPAQGRTGNLKVWFSSPRSKSGLISLTGAFSYLAIPKHKRKGTYKAHVLKSGDKACVVIELWHRKRSRVPV